MTAIPRRCVVVDCESSGLRIVDCAVEVAWWDLSSGERGRFIPEHDEAWVLKHGEPRALEINDYSGRIEGEPQDDGTEVARLYRQVEGAALVGSNIRQDAQWLEDMFIGAGFDQPRQVDGVDVPRPTQPWHHRMWDLSVMAATEFGLDELPGLWDICQMLDLEPEGDVHTAESGAITSGLAFGALRLRTRRRLARA
jgi:hypothetical protein